MLYRVTAPKHLLTNCKSCKIEQHGLSLGLITLSDQERTKRHLLATMFKVFNNNIIVQRTFGRGFIEPLKFIMGYSRKNPHPHYRRHAGKSHGRGGGRLKVLETQTGGGL